MKNLKCILLAGIVLLSNCFLGVAQDDGAQGKEFEKRMATASEGKNAVNRYDISFFNNPKTKLDPRFELLPFGDVRPKGWLYDIMKEDITSGFVGHLDKLAPIILKNNVFKKRRKSLTEDPGAGTQELTGAAWEISMLWWPGETLGNWWDGYVRTAYLVEDKEAMMRSDEIVDDLLSTQDKDGYIGIYSPKLRYKHKGSNGEIWSQAGVFRMLLAYYQITKKEKVLDAVEKAMAVTMKYYNEGAKSPFDLSEECFGGVSHGLMLTDACETLYRLTGKQEYQDYAVYLYKEYCAKPLNRSMNNVRYEYLMDKDILFESHSVHTFEHLRTLINSYYETGYPELKDAYETALNKLSYTILPSGAGFGNEWQNREKAKPDSTGAEFCGMFELRGFYASAAQKTGDATFADKAEKLTFNAMQGARNYNGTGLVYCKTDNCYRLDRKAPQHGFHEEDPRYKYSPTHDDAAVCCNPSYSKSWGYYVGDMWMKAHDGIAAVLYGPSILNTQVNGNKVSIEQVTNYPMSDKIEFKVSVKNDAKFALYFRKPGWVKQMTLDVEGGAFAFENGYYKVTKKWAENETVTITFENEIKPVLWENREVYFQRGPIVYAYSIKHKEEIVRDYDIPNFHDYFCLPTDESYKNISFSMNWLDVNFESNVKGGYENPWYKDNMILKVKDSKGQEVKLIPVGNTVLRRVTFPVKK
ncbi:beta-L-arabinofuranosidase domain-containing protein [Marinilabilia rubra]|uniref:Glycosyl hydrolase n=1 Tax=Marinilabilia rubra TaxID=2162893 RepID=A0A2U2BC28_9BACT|nr:beta-L-arabinofuranosidase domain-containing protein [Marinilabilia rubra]PWE00611.1 hypothetical protein DDZ16_03155 [Marinilabilia rubra]